MYIEVRGERYKVHIAAAANPFAVSHDRIIGITPDAPESMLPEFDVVWQKVYHTPTENKEWEVNGSKGRKHQVLRFGDKFLCDCWPFRKTGGCKHIESVKEECL